MPTRNISLTPEQDAFVEKVVEAGEYQNASEAIRDALRVLQQRRKEASLRLKPFRAQIKVGIDAIERGDFAEVDDEDLEGYFERLRAPAVKRVHSRANGAVSPRSSRANRSCQYPFHQYRVVGRRWPAAVRRCSRRRDEAGRG